MTNPEMRFAGYRVVHERETEEYFGADMPRRFVTACDCLGRPLPDWACHHPHGDDTEFVRGERRTELGLDDEDCAKLSAIVAQLCARDEIVWKSSLVASARGIREVLAVARRGVRANRIRVVGLGLSTMCLEEWTAVEPPEGFKAGSLAPTMSEGRSMPSGGTVLGFEPRLSDDWDLACSWHCNALAAKFVTRTGLKPNAFGMIDDFGTAQEFSRVIAREGLGEPGLWLPWLVVDYTSEIDALL